MIPKKGELKFSVDSALLRELGEHLVGRTYVALAELVKNSFDADASNVEIWIDRNEDYISVSDNGHGMDFEDFKNFWMRIGSTHKESIEESRYFKRKMTGSKGVGRLAAQFLAKKLELVTCPKEDPSRRLRASVDWTKAQAAGELTEAYFEYEIEEDGPYQPGTELILRDLSSTWTKLDVQGLAEEVWWLQPPFRYISEAKNGNSTFTIQLHSHYELEKTFEDQISAILDIWHARIVGKSEYGNVQISLEWAGRNPSKHMYKIKNCKLKMAEFEIRIYHLYERQPRGIKVGEARKYLSRYGGVHIYDSGFRLPYYGDSRNDWLNVEQDHSHRLNRSKLLPVEMQKDVFRAMQFLPTLSRIFGVVNVSSSQEPDLQILVTRDRFRDSKALDNLSDILRYSIDYYSLMEQRRRIRQREKEREIVHEKTRELEEIFDGYKEKIPETVYEPMKGEITTSVKRYQTQAELVAERASVFGTLATAGITSLAYQHETKILFNLIEKTSKEMVSIESSIKDVKARGLIRNLREQLNIWVKRARRTNALFSHLAEPENIEKRERFLAHKVVSNVWAQISFLMKGVKLEELQIDKSIFLPNASIAEWSSIFQNIFLNAYNAMLMSKSKRIFISTRHKGKTIELLVQDTGYGIDLEKVEEFFQPFKREFKLPDEVKKAGYGGSGMGLPIVRLIAQGIGCNVDFTEPDKKYGTAFVISWREDE